MTPFHDSSWSTVYVGDRANDLARTAWLKRRCRDCRSALLLGWHDGERANEQDRPR